LVSNLFNLLLIDDEDIILDTVGSYLSLDFNVYSTSNTVDALEILKNNEIAVAIIDYNLNENINGVEFASSIKHSNPLIQVIMFTGQTKIETVVDALNSGSIDTFLNKPLNMVELRRHIDDNLKLWLKNKKILNDIYDEISNSPLNREEGSIHDYIDLLQELLNKGVNVNTNVDNVQLIGIGISSEMRLIFKYFFTDSFNVKHETIFAGFIETLIRLNKDLFHGSDSHKLHEFSLNEIQVKIMQSDTLTYMFFVTGSISNKKLLNEVMQDFIVETEPVIQTSQFMSSSIEKTLENYTQYLRNSIVLIH